jgi:hypothetical protein
VQKPPRRRTATAILAFAVLVVGVLGLDRAGSDTSAAWNNQANVAMAATSGSWTAGIGGDPVTPGTNVNFQVGALTWTQNNGGKQVCFTAVVTGTTTPAKPWTVDVHVNSRPFNGDSAAADYQLDTWNNYQWVTTTAVDGILQIRGTGPKATIALGQTYTVSVCNYDTPPPVYDAALTYTYATSFATDVNNACVTATVGVSNLYPFYAGWQFDIDLTPLFNLRTNAGLSATGVTLRTGGVSAAQQSGKTYRFTPTDWGTYGVRSAGGSDAAVTQTFIACVK